MYKRLMTNQLMKYFCLILFSLLLLSCKQNERSEKQQGNKQVEKKNRKAVTIKILPLGKTTPVFIQNTFSDLKKIVPNVQLLPKEAMPSFAYYKPRNRYRADSLIAWMRKRAADGEVYLGITMDDISTTKLPNPDHGIMGLGYQPGNACIASNFRVRDKKNYYKVVIHELGHTAGLPHCPQPFCFMRDAEGKDVTGEEKEFCAGCKAHLKKAGWRL
ncbi:MAG: hypothetical protein JNM88_20315 [Chitinophagaceae bacterium]|nr:hypothetical protein [Chitinophagaceae bacterium]